MRLRPTKRIHWKSTRGESCVRRTKTRPLMFANKIYSRRLCWPWAVVCDASERWPPDRVKTPLVRSMSLRTKSMANTRARNRTDWAPRQTWWTRATRLEPRSSWESNSTRTSCSPKVEESSSSRCCKVHRTN